VPASSVLASVVSDAKSLMAQTVMASSDNIGAYVR
jgi:hypothetical protein